MSATPTTKPANDPNELMTVRAGARIPDVHPVTVRRWIAQGKLRAYSFGPRSTRVRRGDIEALAAPFAPGA